ncbi:protein lifeguard 2 isoform X2 [Mus pahari]|uniref:protein lifeguard 2 isoform X2 n=1 Tax=Mus pahari TaxID=10093 RepID=UPI000A308E1D|nr:protein lifeguard 2 isoform X2 [Mus pahari]
MKIDLEVSEPVNFSAGDHQHLVHTAAIKDFIMKVFVVLSVQLFITAAIISIFVFCEPVRKWIIARPWFLYALLDIRRQVPANYILLAFFTILEGLLLGSMSVFYRAEEILWATGATTVVTLVLTLFALQTKCDFTLLSGVMFVFTSVLVIYGIIALVIRAYWLHLVYSALGTLLFSIYLVMDVQMMVGGHYHYEINPEEYIFAALNIYVDIISLFIFILDLIGR